MRLYSIASTRYGDDMTGTTSTLCVRRATYWDEDMQAEDPAKKVRGWVARRGGGPVAH